VICVLTCQTEIIFSHRRDRLLTEEKSLNSKLGVLEQAGGDDKASEEAKEELSTRLVEVHTRLAEMEAETGPARAASLLAGMHISLLLLPAVDLTSIVGM